MEVLLWSSAWRFGLESSFGVKFFFNRFIEAGSLAGLFFNRSLEAGSRDGLFFNWSIESGSPVGLFLNQSIETGSLAGLFSDQDQQTNEKLVSLPCHLGSSCNKGKNGTIWRTADLTFKQALEQVNDHAQFAGPTKEEAAADKAARKAVKNAAQREKRAKKAALEKAAV